MAGDVGSFAVNRKISILMPELPEVETTRLGLAPAIKDKVVTQVIIRRRDLRWPIPRGFAQKLTGLRLKAIKRRGKYLLLENQNGHAIVHLGMSGRIHIVSQETPVKKHDHVDIQLNDGTCLRFNDARRFGCLLWVANDPEQHPLLAKLGVEPLSKDFTKHYLYEKSRNRRVAIKQFIMDHHVVVGVGNIYATEALFQSGIHPKQPADSISEQTYRKLQKQIRKILRQAIKQGGTTLRDFYSAQGKPGYFKQSLCVYDREGLPCPQCRTLICNERIGQRSSYYCPQCQSLNTNKTPE